MGRRMQFKQWMILGLMAVVAVLPACTTPGAQAGPVDDASQTVLVWRGPLDVEGMQRCVRLQLGANDQAQVGLCDEAPATQSLTDHQRLEWAEIRARFAPFTYAAGAEELDFRGAGTIAGPAWERALAAWVRYTVMELRAGRVSASARTAMHWELGEVPGQPGVCRHVTVLEHGYAYAETAPCGGGNVQSAKGGWLETNELETFDALLYGRGFTERDGNYLAGHGGTPLTAEELATLEQWAAKVYERLAR